MSQYFDGWYTDMAGSPVKDEIEQRHLGLPPHLLSTSLLTWDGIAEVTAALRLSPGGTLLVVAHHPDEMPADAYLAARPDMFRSAEQVAASLDPGEGEIRVASAVGRSVTDPDGQTVTVRDTVLRATRRR